MKKLTSVILILLVALSIFAKPTHLVILHLNDTHGHVWGTDDGGGFARIATIVNQVKEEVEEDGYVLLFMVTLILVSQNQIK